MMIHDFETLLSKVKVGDEVIVHWAHKYENGSWSVWSQDIHVVFDFNDRLQNGNYTIYMRHVDHSHQHFYVDARNFDKPYFKFELLG